MCLLVELSQHGSVLSPTKVLVDFIIIALDHLRNEFEQAYANTNLPPLSPFLFLTSSHFESESESYYDLFNN